MFEAIESRPGVTFWRSSLLHERAVPHAFTTRPHNIRSAPDLQDWIRLSGWPDTPAPPTAPPVPPAPTGSDNHAALRVHMARQVHGHAVSRPGLRLREADAVVVDQPGRVAAVRTADCVPILLATRDGHAVAAVHAGWRGLDPTASPGVIAQAVDALVQTAGLRMAQPARGLLAAIGPCIAGRNYPVGPEVADRFRTPHPRAVDDTPTPPHLDCRTVAQQQLRAAGLDPQHIDTLDACTFDHPAFYSYRREGAGVGHQAALIAPRPREASA